MDITSEALGNTFLDTKDCNELLDALLAKFPLENGS